MGGGCCAALVVAPPMAAVMPTIRRNCPVSDDRDVKRTAFTRALCLVFMVSSTAVFIRNEDLASGWDVDSSRFSIKADAGRLGDGTHSARRLWAHPSFPARAFRE